jgi:hypothetical protein
MAANTRRPLDRATVSKLSDARERLHALAARAEGHARAARDSIPWTHDLNAPEPSSTEMPHG